jgi:predicted nucleic acid-binding protein
MDKIVFVDANIFLEIALGDKKSEECKSIIDEIREGKLVAYTSGFIIL